MQSTAPAMSVMRAFELERDASWLHRLWHTTMHTRWSLSLRSMCNVLLEARSLLVAERHGLPVGFCAADYEQTGDAGLLVVLVDPAHQRTGVGSALLTQLQTTLRTEQVGKIHLGALSNGSYFWPGLPVEHESAWPFFVKHGWKPEESCADLVQDLTRFQPPSWVYERLTRSGVVLGKSEAHLRSAVTKFERTNFPAWSTFVDNELASSGDENLIVAQNQDGTVVGTILMEAGITERWARDSGVRIGSLNILGVASPYQGRGIGLALTSRAMELLRDRGCSRCYIQWTGLTAWYGKLGATVWAEYRMAQKAL